MKKKFNVFISKKWEFTLIIFCSFALALVLFKLTNKSEILAATLATGISIAIGLRQTRVESDKLFKELFLHYNNIYATKFNNELARICSLPHNQELTSEEKNLIIDYINFCAEEFMWYKMKRIEKVVWKSWTKGYNYYFSHQNIKKVLVSEMSQSESYYGFFDEMKRFLK